VTASAVVLTYHHVAESAVDPLTLHVSPRHFAEHLQVLRARAHVRSLRSLLFDLLTGIVHPFSVAVTLDDGYLDNLLMAAPLLDAYDVPATVFVTGDSDAGREAFWWDRLAGLCLTPGTLPRQVEVVSGSDSLTFDLGDAASYSEADASRFLGWRAWDTPPTARHAMFAALHRTLLVRGAPQRERILEQLGSMIAGNHRVPDAHRRMSDADIVMVARRTSIDIGAHTATHPALPTIAAEDQAREIRTNQAHLREVVGRDIDLFAYPHGDYSRETVGIVREAGFLGACTTASGPVRSNADPFRLARCRAQDVDGAAFERVLEEAWAAPVGGARVPDR
jgi:peptidoglycan/xylan/chitin deacetylase (PgdA/CDA1 family)